MASRHSVSKETGGQIFSILLCWLVYTCTYLGKYSYNANISLIEDDYAVTHTQAGLVLTVFAAVYGLGQIVNGIICRKYPKRIVVPVVLWVSAAANLLYFVGVPFFAVKYLWILQAAFLSILWPLVVQVISENVGDKLMPRAILIMSTTTSVGTLLIYGISALNARLGNYKLTFIIAAVSLTAVSVLWLLFYKPGNYLDASQKKEDGGIGTVAAPSGALMLIPFALFGLLVIIADFTKDGLQSWAPVILKQMHGMPDSYSILLTLVLPIFGIIGAALAVTFCKKIPVYVVLTMLFFGCITLFNFIVMMFYENIVVLVLSFGVLEFLLHGVINVIVSVLPLALRGKFSSGTISGILNGLSYAGSAASSLLLGRIADVSGWTAVFLTLFVSACIALVLCIVYWLITLKKTALKI